MAERVERPDKPTQKKAQINQPDWVEERTEWLDAIDDVLKHHGPDEARELVSVLREHLIRRGLELTETTLNTPYKNTISLDDQPAYPGDIDIETRIANVIRWNAVAMVLNAYDNGSGVGGHIATYLSAATMMEVGFNHIFRVGGASYGGDQVHFQAHTAPGVYARAFLEDRLTEANLRNYRRELAVEGGLPSYPHPRRLPWFWQMPTASMGLSTPSAIYQARFAKYLESRGLKPKNGGKIWAFIGDGEADEPEVLGTINIASREGLDNLVLVVNCNLQRLDGPVRGNGKIIQELERSFRGAAWHVIKVIWGGGWDPLLARDVNGVLQRRMEQAVDGDYQMYTVSSGDAVREHWVEHTPELKDLMKTMTDEEVRSIKRGGQDHHKIYAAFAQAAALTGKPCVILSKTVKGDGLGPGVEGRNTVHQKKHLTFDQRRDLAKRLGIPLSDDDVIAARFYKPANDSEEMRYMAERRQALGGSLPRRQVECERLLAPGLGVFDDMLKGSERAVSTTMVMVRILSRLLRDKNIGRYVVPIVPDEARTFGMDGLFPQAGIYSPAGQRYQPVDAGSLAPYKESEDGQILQEGICETGAMASFMAAGSAYANHGLPMIPFYIFYSMFGFQRVGDMIWACGDMLCKGFLLGGTSGRTTLNGEGVQHQDGHSHLISSTIPNLVSYDPAFAFELALIVRDGIRRMYQEMEDIFYYLTVTNQAYPMPAMPAEPGLEAQVLKGMYRFTGDKDARVNLFGSGAVMVEVLAAAAVLRAEGIGCNVWSVTSYSQLTRDALEVDRLRLLDIDKEHRPYLETLLEGQQGIFVATSDYQKMVPLSISPWIPGPYCVLGTDGFGLSEAREDLRKYFEVSCEWIVFAALSTLAQNNYIPAQQARNYASLAGLDLTKADPALQ
ncbi:MAG: pyruvate dehydrogenase (acetyl-transferring), homodimeric type [Proteobacteria bacterium]|nr:pyruvate dehydrogenase (acetyl-transferring), homodimeric type [Pseudomonadota bacterium]